MSVSDICIERLKQEGKKGRNRKREDPQQGLKAAKSDRSFLPLSFTHYNININETSCFSHLFFSPSDDLNIKKLKKRKFQELRITV